MIRKRTSNKPCVDFCLAQLVPPESSVRRAAEMLTCASWVPGDSSKHSRLKNKMEWLGFKLQHCLGKDIYLLTVCVLLPDTPLPVVLPESQAKDTS